MADNVCPDDLDRGFGVGKIQYDDSKVIKCKYTDKWDIEMDEERDDNCIIFHPKDHHRFTLIWLHDMDDNHHGFGDVFLDSEGNFDLPAGMKVILP
jgi:hypothetical protein